MSPGIVAVAAVAGFWVIELTLRRGSAARSLRTDATDRGSTVAIIAAYVLVAVALTFDLPGPTMPRPIEWVGAVLSALGVALRVTAFRTLGSRYTRALKVDTDQALVTSGCYRWIRHPGYLSALLIWIGAATASGSVPTAVLVGAGLTGVYLYRIGAEEAMLSDAFGPVYERYRARSWRLVPFVY